jgi:hypothetical protein
MKQTRDVIAVALATAMLASLAVAAPAEAAKDESIGFCSANQALCEPAKVVDPPANGFLVILGLSENVEFANNAFFSTPVKCKMSELSLKLKGTMNNPIPVEVSSADGPPNEGLAFKECTGPCKKVEAVSLPFTKAKLQMTSTTGTWDLSIEEGKVLLTECTFGIWCEYGFTATSGSVKGSNAAPGAVLKAAVELKYKGGNEVACGAVLTWSAEYAATSIHLRDQIGGDLGLHTPWWFTLLGEVDATH